MSLPGVYSEPLVSFRVEMSLGTGDGEASLYDAADSLYDSDDVYSGEEFYWIEVTSRLISCSLTRGRDTFGEQFKPSSASVLLEDSDGVWNPDITGLQIGDLTLRPGRYLRVSGKLARDPDAAWQPLFTGVIDSIQEAYQGAGHSARARFTCTDLATQLARDNPPELPAPEGAGELTGARAERVLLAAGFKAETLAGRIDPGRFTMQSTTLPEDRWSEFRKAAVAEGGAAYFAADGLPVFRGAGWQDPLAPPTLVIGGPNPDVLLINDPTASWDQARVRNDIQLARVGSTAVSAVNTASQSAYGVRSFRLFTYENDSDLDMQTLADEMVLAYAWDKIRLNELSVIPTDEDSVRSLLALDVGDKVRATIATAMGWGYTFDGWVQRVSHELREPGDWITKLQLDNVDRGNPQQAGPYSSAYSDAYAPAIA